MYVDESPVFRLVSLGLIITKYRRRDNVEERELAPKMYTIHHEESYETNC